MANARPPAPVRPTLPILGIPVTRDWIVLTLSVLFCENDNNLLVQNVTDYNFQHNLLQLGMLARLLSFHSFSS
jgi:hypothetical protein